MNLELSAHELRFHELIRDFAAASIAPFAASWEMERGFPRRVVRDSAARGFLGGTLPVSLGGQGWDATTYGLFTEAIAYHSVSLSGLFNVHTMVAQTILRWGSELQQRRLLPMLAQGEKVAAIAFTEPEAGSDLNGIRTRIEDCGAALRVSGNKKWITCGALADIVLVFGRLDDRPAAVLIETDNPGLCVKPLTEMLGFRAAHLAELELRDCEVPRENLIGRPGSALMYLAPYALEFGRVSVMWACLGILRACLEICGEHVRKRKVSGRPLLDLGMIQTLLTDIGVQHHAAFLMALHGSRARDCGDVQATDLILAAKYFASQAAAQQSANAVQIMGALGCDERLEIARHYRDAKTMEIIEGSSQIVQLLLSRTYAMQSARGCYGSSGEVASAHRAGAQA